jgi:hypothetical protein
MMQILLGLGIGLVFGLLAVFIEWRELYAKTKELLSRKPPRIISHRIAFADMRDAVESGGRVPDLFYDKLDEVGIPVVMDPSNGMGIDIEFGFINISEDRETHDMIFQWRSK